MNKLTTEKRALILTMLVKGSSMRSVSRIANVSINTVIKLLVDAGTVCAEYQNEYLVNIKSKHVSMSYVERQNLTMRMGMSRFTRLTNGFSKKIDNLAHAVSLHFMHYNFVRIHKTLEATPAMQAGITNKLWSMDDIVALMDAKEKTKNRTRGNYKTKNSN